MRIHGPLSVALAFSALAAGSCEPRPKTAQERTVTDRERGFRYVVPERWLSFDGEIQSLSGSNLSFHVYELTGADPKFVERLPESLYPQLYAWAKYYFLLDGPPTRVRTQVGGLRAVEVTYPVRIRRDDPLTKTTYWVIRRGSRLHVLRVAYAAGALDADEKSVRELVGTWEFVEPAPTRPVEAVPAPPPGAAEEPETPPQSETRR